jgi:diguanylate cyclase (GGDEF)-like protein
MDSSQTVAVGMMGASLLLILVVAIVLLRRQLERSRQQLDELREQLESRRRTYDEAGPSAGDHQTAENSARIGDRVAFQSHLHQQWRRTARSRLPLSLLMVAVDSVQAPSDSPGKTEVGDWLGPVSEAIGQQIHRPDDMAARVGEGQFGVVLAETDGPGGIAVAERIRAAVNDLKRDSGSEPVRPITVSVGVATTVPTPHEQADSLVAAADHALSIATSKGGNRVES